METAHVSRVLSCAVAEKVRRWCARTFAKDEAEREVCHERALQALTGSQRVLIHHVRCPAPPYPEHSRSV